MKKIKILVALALTAVAALGGFAIYNSLNYSSGSVRTSVSGYGTTLQPSNAQVLNYAKEHNISNSTAITALTAGGIENAYKQARALSNNVIGWIYISGTNISYPLMHGYTDKFWLTHDWLGHPSQNGSIFLSNYNIDLNQSVMLINGHNMADGHMFAQVRCFWENDWLHNGDHLIYIYTGSKMRIYRAFSVFKEPAGYASSIPFTMTGSTNLQSYANILSSSSALSPLQTTDKPILILNTCMVEGHELHQVLCTQQIN